MDPSPEHFDYVEEARRPIIIARHRDAMSAIEQSLTPADLDAVGAEDGVQLLKDLAERHAEEDDLLADLLIRQACMHKDRNTEDTVLKARMSGVYRCCRDYSKVRFNLQFELADLRSITGKQLQNLIKNDPLVFGTTAMHHLLVIPQTLKDKRHRIIKRLRKAQGGDSTWKEAGGEPRLSRSSEAPLMELPEEQRRLARDELIAHSIRSLFFRRVFRLYFERDSLDPNEVASHPTILDWLVSIEETPHLYPFMQGQTQSQKIFRLQRLLVKIIQVNELYQRILRGSQHPTYRDQLQNLNTREKLTILARDRYPALEVDSNFMIASVSCPFAQFARWVQDSVASNDLVLPPER